MRGTARVNNVNGVTDEYIVGAKKVLDAEEAAHFERPVSCTTPGWRASQPALLGAPTIALPKFLSDLAERT